MRNTNTDEEPQESSDGPLACVAFEGMNSDLDRRASRDRRRRVVWAVLYGSFNPRRRRPPRRGGDLRFHSLDWHSSHLLVVSIGILLLSVADAFMTTALIGGGAVEVNPIMASVVYGSAATFAVVKMALTGFGVTMMVVLARYRFMRVVRVDVVMYLLLLGYVGLLAYEYSMLRQAVFPIDF